MKYRRQDQFYNYPASPCGQTDEPDYQPGVDENGSEIPVADGVIHRHAQIQSAAVGTTLPELVARASRGDLTAIPAYDESKLDALTDVTTQPTSLMEAQNRIIQAKNIFNKLPAEQRQFYNQDPSQFLSALASGEYAAKFISPKKKQADADKAAREALAAKEEEKKFASLIARIKEELA